MVGRDEFRRILEPKLSGKIELIIKLGNQGAHDGKMIKQYDAISALSELHHFMHWMYITYFHDFESGEDVPKHQFDQTLVTDPRPLGEEIQETAPVPVSPPKIDRPEVAKIEVLGNPEDKHDYQEGKTRKHLAEFMIELDDQQNKAIRQPLDKGPYLYRGSAGTGKTLICIYRLIGQIEHRVGSSLFEKDRYLFVTYNRLLCLTCERLYSDLTADKRDIFQEVWVEFQTVDSIMTRFLGQSCPGMDLPKPAPEKQLKQIAEEITEGKYPDISPPIPDEHLSVLHKKGISFVLSEIAEVIYGSDLRKKEDYLAFERHGRVSSLQEKEREAIWDFHEVLEKVLQSKNLVTWEKRRRDALLLQEDKKDDYEKFSGIFVDEAQDMSLTTIRFLVGLAKSPMHMTFALDPGQTIYGKSCSWQKIDKRLKIRPQTSFELKTSYRMTKEIDLAVQPIRLGLPKDEQYSCEKAALNGPKPVLLRIPWKDHAENVVKIAQLLYEEEDIHFSAIAILLRSVRQDNEAVLELTKSLSEAGLQYSFANARDGLNPDLNAINILTYHSAKGFNFPCVILPYVSNSNFGGRSARTFDEVEEIQIEDRRLFYVGCSRASRRLFVLENSNTSSTVFLKDINLDDWSTDL